MQNPASLAAVAAEDEAGGSLQGFFRAGVAAEDIEQVFLLKKAQPLLQAFTALFHGGFDGVLVRLLVLRELAAEVQSTALSRADINARLGYLDPDSLETVLARLRSHDLLAWDQGQGVYRVTPTARNILAALESLIGASSGGDEADMGFLLSQVAGAQAIGGITAEQLHHLLGRLVELTEEFRDAIASGSEFRLRTAQAKWHIACDWVERGSAIMNAITADARADNATHRAAQAIGRAQSALLNMQGMFSRALNQIERQRVHLGQSGLSTSDIKTWLMRQDDLASLASGALSFPVMPGFITPHEMLDVAESELQAGRDPLQDASLPPGEEVRIADSQASTTPPELAKWLDQLDALVNEGRAAGRENTPRPARNLHEVLLPASFAIASYRASLLPLLGDESEAVLQGPTATLAGLPLAFTPRDVLKRLSDPHVAAMSAATLNPTRDTPPGQPGPDHA
ncbi:MAG: hypothetical protein JWP36_2611 [Paucimonas sp.]|nr:hypothetical protein [Paucimonas sp.]